MNTDSKKILICIGGPTASGKTTLAIELALHFKTDIISADSRQIYKYFDIGTAKPSNEELNMVKHYLIDELEPDISFNAGEFERRSLLILDEIFSKNQYAIMVGGTGLFFRAILEGLDEFPEVPPTLRDVLQRQYEEVGLSSLQEQLLILDPEYFAQMDINNPTRIIRALSVCIASGQPYSSFLNSSPKKRDFKAIKIAITPDREMLYSRINQRVEKMLEQGLENEVKHLLQYKDAEAFNTVGYKEWLQYFDGVENYINTIEFIKRNSRRYAKRQFTWFNNQGSWNKISKPDLQKALEIIAKSLQ